MRPQKIGNIELLDALATVFRSKGFEDASLNDLSEVTGLKKASLYHRFPEGKNEMAQAVLEHIGKWVDENIFSALNAEINSPKIRLETALSQIKILYNSGIDNCFFRAFSMQKGFDLFDKSIENGLNEWITAFTEFGISCNLAPSIAKKYAMQTLIEIQGSLIVNKGLGNNSIFENTLKNIEDRYLKD